MARPANVSAVLKLLLLSLLLILAGCANRRDSNADEDRIHGSVGVRWQSQDTARFAPERAPF